MAYTTINKSTDYFNTKLYTGNGGTLVNTGVGFQPDLVWVKSRTQANSHVWFDAIRTFAGGKEIQSNNTGAEGSSDSAGYGYISAVSSDGFTAQAGTTAGDYTNVSSQNYVSWNWKANGTGSSNTAGSINSTVSVNTTSGFSIVKWTGNGGTASVGHGLGVKPNIVIKKNLAASTNWIFSTTIIDGSNDFFYLNSTNAKGDSGETAPTASLINLYANSENNGNGNGMIAYCFAEKQGYSKFGRFTANGSTNNTFVYTGFKPAFVMMKCDNVTDGWSKWYMFDTARSPENMNVKELEANTNSVESGNGADYAQIDMLSNGFKLRNGSSWGPASSGNTNIYMAFAEAPLVGTNNVPCTAR